MTDKNKWKVWRATRDAPAGFMVTPDTAMMIGNSQAFIAVNQNGIHLSGPMTIIASGEQIRQGGLFVKMPDFVKMIPSTQVTPLPDHIPSPPTAFVSLIKRCLPVIAALSSA